VILGEIGRQHCLRIKDLGKKFWRPEQSSGKNFVSLNLGPRNAVWTTLADA